MLGSSLLALTPGDRITQSFKQFAKKAGVMYMGSVKQHSVEYHLVRGFTASHQHKDTDHCIGTFLHHDFIALHRSTPRGRVVITEVDLHTLHPFSHFFVIPNALDRKWFDGILQLYPHHRQAPYAPHDRFSPKFKDEHSVLALPTHFERSLHFASDEVAKCISTIHSERYVFEVIDHSLFVYNFEAHEPTEKSLDLQVRFACTLATALETRNK
jgi:hypothetical protein